MMAMAYTLAQPVQYELEVKHSRFLALASPVTNPDAALAFLREVSVADLLVEAADSGDLMQRFREAVVI